MGFLLDLQAGFVQLQIGIDLAQMKYLALIQLISGKLLARVNILEPRHEVRKFGHRSGFFCILRQLAPKLCIQRCIFRFCPLSSTLDEAFVCAQGDVFHNVYLLQLFQ
jgi:hypothetical protein